MTDQALFPVFLKLEGRRVLLVGGGAVAASRLAELVGPARTSRSWHPRSGLPSCRSAE